MQTLTWQKHANKLNKLKRTFPQLWANYKRNFHQFFHPDGTMNPYGYCSYDKLKKCRRMRMNIN